MFGMFERSNFDGRPDDLIAELSRLHAERKMDKLTRLCGKNIDSVRSQFEEWKRIPAHIRADSKKQENFVQTLIYLAEVHRKAGDDSLIKKLLDNASDNPIEQWQNNIIHAQELSASGDMDKSKQLLLATIPELDESVGNARQALLPKAYGHLGVVLFHLNDLEGAVSNTHKALVLCREFCDWEGVASYTGNLVELMEKMGIREENDLLINERVAALKLLGKGEEASAYASRFSA